MTKENHNEPTRGDRSGPEEHRLQGHWLLAKLGKKVLRPGGMEMTTHLISYAKPTSDDRIVEFGPGVGKTASLLLEHAPREYVGVDPNTEGTEALLKVLHDHQQARLVKASAEATGLDDSSFDLVFGEAMLTMQSDAHKLEIMREAARILAPGGRYVIHELGIHPEDIDPEIKKKIQREISVKIKVGARPLTVPEWSELLAQAGLEVDHVWTNPMQLLEPKRVIADEGILGFIRFASRVARNRAARERILGMRKIFRTHAENMNAVGIVARKPVASV